MSENEGSHGGKGLVPESNEGKSEWADKLKRGSNIPEQERLVTLPEGTNFYINEEWVRSETPVRVEIIYEDYDNTQVRLLDPVGDHKGVAYISRNKHLDQ